MKKDLSALLVKECCTGKKCDDCGFLKPNLHCYLHDIIKIIKNSEKENSDYEK